MTAADLLAPEEEGGSEIAAAVEFVRERLSGGPKLVRDLEKQFPSSTLKEAGKKLGISRGRDSENGLWLWSLPNSVGDKK